MFSRSLTTSPSPSPSPNHHLQVSSHSSSLAASRSPSPPPGAAQTPGTFDVTLLMPHRYGGVSELHQPMGPGFSHFTTPEHFVRERDHGRSRAFDFYGDNPEEGDDEDEDYLMGSQRSMGNSGSNSGGNSVLNSSMGSGGGGTPTKLEMGGGGTAENGSVGIMDMLSLRLPQRRSQSRLSKVIQVRPYGGGTGRPAGEELRMERKREDSVDSQDTDEDEIKEADMGDDDDDDETGIRDSRSMRSFRVKPAARVSRSRSFNLLSTAQSPMIPPVAPTSNSLCPSPHPRGYSGLSPNPSPRRDVPFIPRKLSSNDMYSSTSEIRRSRVTL